MKSVYKGIVFAFTAAIFLSLCLTIMVFAIEEPSAATPSDAGKAAEKEELLTATPSGAAKVGMLTATSSNAVEDTVSTGEELMEWLSGHKDTGGTAKLTDDISISDFYYARNMRAEAVTIDTGEFTIAVNGYVYLQATSPLTIRGVGGEHGLLRTNGAGSMLHLNGLDLKAETGYDVFQEEGTGFILENTSVSGEIHYAEQPFVWEWEPALAVVERGEILDAEMLPDELSARVNRQGQLTEFYEEVPVTWDLTGYEEDQKLRRRFTALGVFEEMASQTAPDCTVVYDDFPLTFLNVKAYKVKGRHGDTYRFTGGFSKPEDRLPITVAQEYSFDGENWTLYQETTATTPGTGFYISPFMNAEDRERYSEVFIRLHWNDAGTVYYSNILRFEADSLWASEEPGGNRGGGTDIVDPPGPPEPDSEPEPETPPVTSKPEPVPPPVTSKPEPVPPPETSEPEPVPPPEMSEPGIVPPPETSEPEPAPPPETSKPGPASPPETPEPEPALPETSEPETVLPPEPSDPTPGPPGNCGTEPESSGGGECAEALAEPETGPAETGPGVLSAAAGLTAIAVSIGGAALYLHSQAWKKLLEKLKNRIKR